IVGRTGCGKSTIADLLLRMYDVTDGQILIDGNDIRTLDLANLRRRIGYVPQDVFLFSDSIYNNIRFGSEASNEDIEQMAKNVAVFDDIMGLPEQFETVVGERGVTLSGGQKQRIAIARALVKDPDIVILDDCLSAVDANTEKQILEFLNQFLADRSAIIITHRIFTLLNFDQILVMKEGKIVEQGNHEKLLSLGGMYKEMFDQQLIETDNL
ncbi:MAG TPA: ATP-binding cassette domain-containing protein, partial [Saprospiraceae bacterium]|nr:ATP-binding cassette domain-containing protein [Saprospiraceae bacterium]